ncbi:hypothetical protein WPS_15640 [Vulcanimicrobium alpinum]|uniref:Glucosamine inositolphosphorylceramide transferase 1 N-terminal domain-containing protein n=1 Tax=Vulcanimicrobium alpinum TaxID=3016050 RepID=A0AAN1XVN1_UNVUL|nr:hypothetical protein [Vulcanimicrobium alpinum]BDE06288.1 hypothetical protein WPS_15640 [Vulcanimicrobium alpinum]
METARLGVVAGDLVYAWQRDALDRLRANGAAIVARFAARKDEGPAPLPPPAARLASGIAAAFAPVRWDAPPIVSPERAAHLDAVLIFAQAAVPEFLLRARWGMWEVVLPGDPPAFDLVERGAPVAEVRVERVGASERTVITTAATLVDRTSYRSTLRRVVDLAVSLPADAVRRSRAAVAEQRLAPPAPNAARISARRAALLSIRCALRRGRHAVVRRLVHDRWRLGVLRTDPAAIVSGTAAQISWLDLPRGHFWADPFPFASGGRFEVLCEGYDYGRDRGYLARVPLEGGRVCGPPRDLARLDHHLSYPYVVEDGTSRYVMPEQSQARRVALYEVTSAGLREARVLIEGVAAVDPTLLRRDDRWWLFITDDAVDNNGELLLFHAATLDGPWDAHPLNPIVRDVRCARPAGTPFVIDGVLYRPAQDCSDDYGARVAIARVDVLTPSAYRETVVAHVAPPAHGRGRHGLHTFALRDGLCVVDGKDRVFDPAATLAILRSDVRRLRRTSSQPSHTSAAPQVFQPS